MPQLVATINGKKVYSDKNVSSVRNTKISFSDGSWCDVLTGEVVNEVMDMLVLAPQTRKVKEKKRL